MAHAGGRPTKYNEDILARTVAFFYRYFTATPTIETKTPDKDGKEITIRTPNPEYYRPPYKEQLALELDVDDETLIEWRKKYPEFSAIIKKIEQLQKLRLYELSFEKNSATGSIFQLKVHHGMIEKTQTDITSKGQKIEPTTVVIVEDTKSEGIDKDNA